MSNCIDYDLSQINPGVCRVLGMLEIVKVPLLAAREPLTTPQMIGPRERPELQCSIMNLQITVNGLRQAVLELERLSQIIHTFLVVNEKLDSSTAGMSRGKTVCTECIHHGPNKGDGHSNAACYYAQVGASESNTPHGGPGPSE